MSKFIGCPYCYDGYIKYEKLTGVFYCIACHKEVEIIGYPHGTII